MNILNVPLIVALCGALIVVGCDRQRPEADTVAATGSGPTTPRPPTPVTDPSVPQAGPALAQPATPPIGEPSTKPGKR